MAEPREIVELVEASGRDRFGGLTHGSLAEAVSRALAGGAAPETIQAHAAEVYLGAACAARDPAALAIVEREYIARIPAMIAAKRLPAHAVDELVQLVRERLLAGDPPYVATCAGRGSLAGLVAVIANRAAIDRLRVESRAARRDEPAPAPDDLVASSDPAREHLRARYSAAIKAAFEAAVAELEARDRTLLRMYLVEQLTIDDLARLFQIHRATAARQLDRAREQVASTTRRVLARTEGITPRELAEVNEVVVGQLDLSLSRVLATATR